MAGSLKYGQATASLVVGKWSAASRQNTLAAALKERGMLRRTLHAAKYLSDPAYRRKIARQLRDIPDELLAHISPAHSATSSA
ncbi:Tn3 family transposase [Nonomuraea purpurea]|uniref:Tn3 family transposase n=1 Tax=Nonomuraea purpurea TaxID=1849276 RepID=A0ABV8GN48_9ACTN